MIAKSLISPDIIPVRTSDTGNSALMVMSDFKVDHLPVVNNKELLGVISEEVILNHPLTDDVGSMEIIDGIAYAHEDDHIFEVMRLLVRQKLSAIPVVDYDKEYLGIIHHMHLLEVFAESYSLAELGATLLIKIKKSDYSLAELTRIIESEGGKVLCTMLTTDTETDQLLVSLKLSSEESERIVATLTRMGYQVEGNFTHEQEYEGLYKDRYNSFLHYLNI